jgi:acetyl esterase/lipase
VTGQLPEQLPPDVIAQLRALDPTITPELAQASWALLTPFHEKAGYTAPAIDRDLAYGDDPRHRLDVHTGDDGDDGDGLTGKPVLLYVHGGGFVRGDKHIPGSPQYDLVGAWAVRHGYVGVTMTYRLAPEHMWPSGAEDVAKAVQWLRQNIAGYGGDPDKIVVAGSSAGAVHVASFAAGQGGADPRTVAAAAMLSGIYVIVTPQPGEPEHAYYGPDPEPRVSPVPRLLDSPIPLLFSVAERDPLTFQREAARLVSAWLSRHGTVPDLVWVEGHNHMSTIGSLTVDEPALGTALARFIDRHTNTTKETAQ